MRIIGSVHGGLRALGLLLCLTAHGCSTEVGGKGDGLSGEQDNSLAPDPVKPDAAMAHAHVDARAPLPSDPPTVSPADAGRVAPDAALPSTPVPSDAAVVDAAQPQPLPDAAVGEGGALCGTRGAPECPAGQWCELKSGTQCGALDQGGVCKPLAPKLCPQVYLPVCGCDGHTYSNSCTASSAGVSIQHDGACVPVVTDPNEPAVCGGIAGLTCSGQRYCNYEPANGGQGCDGIADASGVCLPRVSACSKIRKPVCGCDGKTYENACEAHRQEVSVAREGECKKGLPGPITTDLECEAAGGIVTFGTGPLPKCDKTFVSTGSITLVSGDIPFEGAICCLKL